MTASAARGRWAARPLAVLLLLLGLVAMHGLASHGSIGHSMSDPVTAPALAGDAGAQQVAGMPRMAGMRHLAAAAAEDPPVAADALKAGARAALTLRPAVGTDGMGAMTLCVAVLLGGAVLALLAASAARRRHDLLPALLHSARLSAAPPPLLPPPDPVADLCISRT